MYNDRCTICQGFCNPYEDDPKLANAVLLQLPNVHHLGNRRRASTLIVCFSCLEKLGNAFERKLEITYDHSNMTCVCLSLLDDPTLAASNGNKLEQYLGVANFLGAYVSAYAPIDYTDFRRAVQWRLTSDWSSRLITNFVSEIQYYWDAVDFYDLTARLWTLYNFEMRPTARVIVKHRFINNGWPTWEYVKTERHVQDEFIVIVSTELESKTFSSLYLSKNRWNEYTEVMEDFDIDYNLLLPYFRSDTKMQTSASNYGQGYIDKVLYKATGSLSYDGNIGMQKIRTGGLLRYEG